jgi:bacillithiol system protein YtxJ
MEQMHTALVELSTVEAFDDFVATSSAAPVIVYKHSLTCGTSAAAFEEIEELADELPEGVRLGMVRVQAARGVSNHIAARLGVRHESPQVLVIADGRVVWHASHYRVTAEQIAAALGRLGAVGPPPSQ